MNIFEEEWMKSKTFEKEGYSRIIDQCSFVGSPIVHKWEASDVTEN